MFSGTPAGSLVDAFASHATAPSLLTSRHSQKEAYKQAVHEAWDKGNNPYAAAAKIRRQQRGTVVQQGLTPSPLQPAMSQLGYNSGGHASLALRPGMAPLPTSVNAPALAPDPNIPGLPQNPLGIEMGRGSSMYAKGIPNNGMPDLWSSTCLAQGEFAGTYKDPITGITYAMVSDQPIMEGVAERGVHAVYERDKPSRSLEALTGVPASNILVRQPKEIYAGPEAVIESQAPLPSQISEYIRNRQTQAAVLETFDAGGTEQLNGLQEDGFKDGMLGSMYILRPRYDTQTLMDNNETNTGIMNRWPNPDYDGQVPDPSRDPETRPIFYMARPKPSLPSRTHVELDDGAFQTPRQEISDRLQRQMASLPTRTQVNLEDINPAPRQDVYDRLPQGMDAVVMRAPDAMELNGLTRVPLISERINDSTAALAGRQTAYGMDSDVYGARSIQISENGTARDAGVLGTRLDVGGVQGFDGRARSIQVSENGTARDAGVLRTRLDLGGLPDFDGRGGGARSIQVSENGTARDADVMRTRQDLGGLLDFENRERGVAVFDSGNARDGRAAAAIHRIELPGGDPVGNRAFASTDSGRANGARVAMSMPRISLDQEVVTARSAQTSDGGNMFADRLAANRQGIYTDAEFRESRHAGVQESLSARERANSHAALYPNIEFGGSHRSIAADGDMGEDARILQGRQQLADAESVYSRATQVDEASRLNPGAVSRTALNVDMDGYDRGSGNSVFVYDGGLGSQGRTAMQFALPRIDGFEFGNRAVAVSDSVGKEKAGGRPGAIIRSVMDDSYSFDQVRIIFADSSRPDMANPAIGQHTLHGFDLENTLSKLKPAHYRDDYAPMQTDRHGLVIINPEMERDATNPANVVRDLHAIKAYLKSQEANANKNPVMCMTRESYETDAYDTDG